MITLQIYMNDFVPANLREQVTEAEESEKLFKATDDYLNEFIQIREF